MGKAQELVNEINARLDRGGRRFALKHIREEIDRGDWGKSKTLSHDGLKHTWFDDKSRIVTGHFDVNGELIIQCCPSIDESDFASMAPEYRAELEQMLTDLQS